MMRVPARGLVFDVRVGGEPGSRPVLMLHGFPQHGGMFDEVAPLLHAHGVQTFAPDLRGYSPGARPAEEGYDIDDCVADAVALLDALGLDRVDVVGHDWGAVMGWHLAADHADRVRTLTAISVPHPVAMRRAYRSDGGDQARRSAYMQLFAMAGKAEQVLLADGAHRLRGLFHPLPPQQAERYVRPLLQDGALTGALSWYRRLRWADLQPARVPVTFLWGEQDVAIGRVAAYGCAELVADGVDFRFVELAGVSHWVVDEVPAVVAREVLARLDG